MANGWHGKTPVSRMKRSFTCVKVFQRNEKVLQSLKRGFNTYGLFSKAEKSLNKMVPCEPQA